MGFSASVKISLLDHFFGKAVYTPISNIYVGVSISRPDSSGGNITETIDPSYSRQLLSSVDWSFAEGTSLVTILNLTGVVFAPATIDWFAGEAIPFVVLFSAATSGIYLGYGELARPKQILIDDQLTFPATKIRMALD